MENNTFSLEDVYDPERFRKIGHELIDLLADNLSTNIHHKRDKVFEYTDPDQLFNQWQQEQDSDPISLFKKIQENSIQLQHPRYMGHQVCVPAPITALASLQGTMLNSGGAIYEMSAAASVLEKYVIDTLKPYFGFNEGDGMITSGGTLANLTALICARNVKSLELDPSGNNLNRKYAFMVSEEAHYCIERAVQIMGWGSEGIIKIKVGADYVMDHESLQDEYDKAKEKGITVLGVVGSAPTTSTGKYDDLRAIGRFCKTHNLWFHVDAAHGGPAAFSPEFKHLMCGVEWADSLVVDAHKMMMTSSLTTLVFYAKSENSYRTFAQQAQYLWQGQNQEWYNYGKRTMECTKIMFSTRVYMILQCYGLEVIRQNVERLYRLGYDFAKMIQDEKNLELAVQPDSNIVCFRVRTEDPASSDRINTAIRKKILADGSYYIVQTTLKGSVYLRVSLMNPFTTHEDLKGLLKMVLDIHKSVL